MRKRGWVSLAAVVGLALLLGFASAGGANGHPRRARGPGGRPGRVRGHGHLRPVPRGGGDGVQDDAPHGAPRKGCEGCHGPGKAHVEAGGDKTKIKVFKTLSALDSSAACMECHNKGGQKHWMGSSHDSRQIACTQLPRPAPEGRRSPKALLKQPQMMLCTSCHLQKKAQLLRPGHMPLREGKLQCTSCHNPHGTPNDKMLLQTSVNQNCYTCHAEKRGPFLWEHAPGPRELPQLPRRPRHDQREDAEGEAAAPLPAVPPDLQPPRPGLSRAVAVRLQPGLPALPPGRSTGRSTRRATGSSGKARRTTMTMKNIARLLALAAILAPSPFPPPPSGGRRRRRTAS